MLVKDELEDVCRKVAVKYAILAGPSGAAGHTSVCFVLPEQSVSWPTGYRSRRLLSKL